MMGALLDDTKINLVRPGARDVVLVNTLNSIANPVARLVWLVNIRLKMTAHTQRQVVLLVMLVNILVLELAGAVVQGAQKGNSKPREVRAVVVNVGLGNTKPRQIRPLARVAVLVNTKPKLVRQVVMSVHMVNIKILDLKLRVTIVEVVSTVRLDRLPAVNVKLVGLG